MISWNVRVTCEKARPHYYDCLEDPTKVDVPQGIRDHVKDCTHCREEIERLNRVLSSDNQTEEKVSCHASMINGLLNLHFRYAESIVTCSAVKLFLASLADPEIELRVPTPITAHIDHCPQCAGDLNALKLLGLSNEQLRRLNQLFSDLLTKDADVCHANDDIVQAVAAIYYADIDTTTLKHLCVCSHCRDRVTEARKTRSRSYHQTGDEKLCNTVNLCDLFDYVFPYGFNPLSDSCHEFRQFMVEHVRGCPNCLNKMLAMDRRIYVIGDRPDSGVTTCFHIETNTVQDAISQKRYEGYPICVDVRHSPMQVGAESTVTKAEESLSKTTSSQHPIRRLSWFKSAAMIVLVLGLSVFSWLPRAGAGFLDKIYQATLDVPVVHIAMTEPETGVMLREFWVFPKENYVILGEKDVTTALDLQENTLTTLDHQSGLLDTVLLKEDMRQQMEQQIRTLFSLMPFGFQSQLARVSDETLNESTQNEVNDVYEMKWTDVTSVSVIERRWRAYVEPSSNRLQKVHWYTTDPLTGSFFESRCDYLDYPTLSQVEHLLEQVKLPPVTL